MDTALPAGEQKPDGVAAWIERSPIPWLDQFFVLAHWAFILLVTVVVIRYGPERSLPSAGRTVQLVTPAAVLPAFILYEAIASVYIWRKRPLASGQAGWFLVFTLLFAALFYAITGGIGSIFYYPFALVVIHAALSLKIRAAALFIIGVAIVHLLIGPLLIPHANWNADLARVAVGESTVLLVLGGVALFFTEQLRRDARAYHAALIQAQRSALLNEVSLRLAEHGLNLTRVLEIIADAACRLPQTDFALVMQFDAPNRQLRVVASTTERHPLGEVVHGLELPTEPWRIHGAGAGYPAPLPAYFAHDDIRQAILLPLLLPGGDMLGVIGLGRQSDQPLSTHEQAFVQDLSAEAGLAIRNARLYAREQEQVERLRRFQELQTTYFSALAHEMKTPLTVLKTLVPSLRQLPDLPDETRREILDTIDGNLARLEWAIHTPLESVRLEAGVITLHPRPLNLAHAIRQVADRISPWLALKHQRVSLEASRDLPPVLADSSQLDQVISNLLVNAIKFAPLGSTISVTLHPADRTMQVWVEDEGPGVPPEERERIFDKFHSIAAAQTSGGAGLGLYICREVVQKHGGRIWVEDRPGGGSRFCFTLPLADEEDDEESQL